jgi:erythritol kinase
MQGDVIIGLDAGTSVIKAIAFTVGGEAIAAAERPNAYVSGPGGAVEQDMARTWTDAVTVLRDLVGKIDQAPRRISAIAVTGQGDGTWLVDGAGEPVAPAPLWLDSRAAGLVEDLCERGVARAIYEFTGCGFYPCGQAAQLAWYKKHRPELLSHATTAFHCKDWLYFRLTGERTTDPSEAGFTFGNFRTRDYEPDILGLLDMQELARLQPPILDGAAAHHPLSSEAADSIGLPAGMPVVLGYVDVVCTALGGGLCESSGEVGLSILGSTCMHMRLVRDRGDAKLNEFSTGYTMAFPLGRAVAQMQSSMSGTLNIDWLIALLREVRGLDGNADRAAQIAEIDRLAHDAPPGRALYAPHIAPSGERGPFQDSHARAQFVGFDSNTRFADLARSVLEGVALAARDCFEVLGGAPAEIRVAGGGAKSQALRKILAAALDRPVRRSLAGEEGTRGVAMIAMVSLGAATDVAACARAWVDPFLSDPEPPEAPLAALYRRLFPVYRGAREAMRGVWPELAKVRQEFS